MTKLLHKAFDEAAKLQEREQDALALLLLDAIESERRWDEAFASSEDLLRLLAERALAEHRHGMPWQEIRERYPHQWLLLEAIEAYSSGGQRILESLAVLETYPDGLSVMRGYSDLRGQDPHRELYFLHTDREILEIEEVHWQGIRAAS